MLVLCGLFASAAWGQATYRFNVSQMPMTEALQQWVNMTQLELAYDPILVKGKTASCVLWRGLPEDLLHCILSGTDLDFFRLSSGTYVLTRKAQAEPEYGGVYGTVTDDETGEPLPYATVYLADAGLGMTTNENGWFSLPQLKPGAYQLLVSFVGYEAYRQTISVLPNIRHQALVSLKAAPVAVMPVVIEGLQALGLDGEGATFLAQNEAEVLPQWSSGGAMQALHSILGVRKDHVTSDVFLQGSDVGEQEVRLDQAPVYLPISLGGMLGAFSPFAIRRMQVYKAGYGAAQGSLLGGVVNIEHAVPYIEKTDLQAQLDPMSLNLRAVWGKKHKSWQWAGMAAGRQSMSRWYQPKAFTQMLTGWAAPDFLTIQTAIPIAAGNGLKGGEAGGVGNLSPSSFTTTIATPIVAFQDFHTAIRARVNNRSFWLASYYVGNQFVWPQEAQASYGGLNLNYFNAVVQNFDVTTGRQVTYGEQYGWQNRVWQVRNETVLSSQMVASLQVRSSRYNMNHAYRDALQVVQDNYVEKSGDPYIIDATLANNVADGNRITEQAAEATLEWSVSSKTYARGNLGWARTRSDFQFSNIPIQYAVSLPRLFGYVEHRYQPNRRFSMVSGLRVTYPINWHTPYAEPRLAITYRPLVGEGQPLSLRFATGLYRQFVCQFDMSTFSATHFLPTMRIWLPITSEFFVSNNQQTPVVGADRVFVPAAPIAPPKAWHSALEALYELSKTLEIRAEGFYKSIPLRPILNWQLLSALLDPSKAIESQAFKERFIFMSEGFSYGAGFTIAYKTEPLQASLRYDWSYARFKDPIRFGENAWQATPSEQPHAIAAKAAWKPHPKWLLVAHWQGIWGRSWGYRRVYYDYSAIMKQEKTQFLNPSQDKLPAFSQLDLAVAYQIPLAKAGLQLRADLLNATGRKNIMDWQLEKNETGYLSRTPRYMLPFAPSLSVRAIF